MKRPSIWLSDGIVRYLALSQSVRIVIAIVVFLGLFIGSAGAVSALRWSLSCGVGGAFFALAFIRSGPVE